MNLLITTQKADKNDQNLGFFHAWIREFAKHFDQVTVICLEEGEHELPANVKVLSLGKEAGKKVASEKLQVKSRFKYAIRFYRYIWRERKNYDVVFVHMNPEYAVLGGCFWRLWGKKVALWYTHKSVDLKLHLAEKLVNIVFTASAESFRLPSSKVRVMGHGIDLDYFTPDRASGPAGPAAQPRSGLRLITIGRVASVKRLEVMIEAVKILRDKAEEATLTLVGGPINEADREYEARLKSECARLGMSNFVEFVGPVAPDRRLGYLHRADVFVSASRTGSLDKTPLEAIASGVIAVGSNDALRPILSPYGLFFEHGEVDGLAAILLRIAHSADMRDIADRLRETVVREHSLSSLISRLSADMSA